MDAVQFSEKARVLKAFEQQLLRYKALVYEQYMTPLIQQEYSLSQTEASKPVILVIEDNVDEWFLVRWTLLQHFPDTRIVWAPTAPDATAYLKECVNEKSEFPHLILVDLYLPTAKFGLGVIKALKTHRLLQKIPLVAISRSDQVEDIVNAFMHSSDSYIIKPNSYAEWKEAFTPLKKFLPSKLLNV